MVLVSTKVIVPSSLKYLAMSGVVRSVLTIGTGSAMPVVSMMTPSSGLPVSICFRMASKAPKRSPRTVQHMQPFSMTITCSAMPSAELASSSLSMGTAPNSFSITANFFSRWCNNRWLSTVVFPAPRKPVKIVMGTSDPGSLGLKASWADGQAPCWKSPTTSARSPAWKCEVACSCGTAAAPRTGFTNAVMRTPTPFVAQKRSTAEASCRTVHEGSSVTLLPTRPFAYAGTSKDAWKPSVTCDDITASGAPAAAAAESAPLSATCRV
mmetsp:Transcript_79029/g.226562  ORF Transcript_79029/g.226562 Transcript_79029/m.226562 type:complete len:267 (+) Transcript_79029:332-1132(+)